MNNEKYLSDERNAKKFPPRFGWSEMQFSRYLSSLPLSRRHYIIHVRPVMLHRLDGDMYPRERIPFKCSAESLKTLDTDSLKSLED